MQDRIAIIAGSAEARALAQALGARLRWVGLPEPARLVEVWPVTPTPLPQGSAGLADQWRKAGITAVIDASHPCDADTPHRVARAARLAGLPRARLIRPAWPTTRADRWVRVRRLQDVARFVPPGARLLVTTGAASLQGLRGLRGVTVLCRQLDRHDFAFPLKTGRYLFDKPPFSERHEARLMRRHRVDAVLTCNAGGPGGWPKLAAARRLGLPVLMLDRPAQPSGPAPVSVAAALHWLERL